MKKILFLLLACSNYSIAQPLGPGAFTTQATTNPAFLHTGVRSGPSPTTGSDITPTTNPVTAAQWHFAGQNTMTISTSSGPVPSQDWLYSIVSTNKKEYIGCGYSLGTPGGGRDGFIVKLDHNGQAAWSRQISTISELGFSTWQHGYSFSPSVHTFSDIAGTDGAILWQITKASDGYVAVGKTYHKNIVIAEIDENGNFLNGTPIEIDPPVNPLGANLPITDLGSLTFSSVEAAGYSVAVDPNTNSVKNIIIGGTIQENSTGVAANNRAFILTMNYSGGTTTPGTPSLWSIGNTCYGGNNTNNGSGAGGSVVTKILTKSTGTNTYDIFGCGAISGSNDNNLISSTAFSMDKDIWVVSMSYNSSTTNFSSLRQQQYNKGNISVGGTYINSTSYAFTYTDVGPLSARNFLSSGGTVTGLRSIAPSSSTSPSAWFADHTSDQAIALAAPNNQVEEGCDMIIAADGNLALIGLVNVIGNVECNLHNGSPADYHLINSYWDDKEYQDGDGFLLKIDISDVRHLLSAKNVGHFSSNDMLLNIRQDRQGHFIVAGSTSDFYGTFSTTGYAPSPDINLVDPQMDAEGSYWNAFIVCTNDDAYPDLWRRSFVNYDTRNGDNNEDLFCLFGLDTTADGGYVICGNNDNHGDDISVTKFAPLQQELMLAGIGGNYTTFGNSFIPSIHTVSGTENWPSSNVPSGSNIATWVVVPNGAVLNINSGTYNFAASDQLWDYFNAPSGASGTLGCGIVVEPGGHLNIQSATLGGISFSSIGQHNVWDGIVVQGTYADPSSGLQGRIYLGGATIRDARFGVYMGDNFRFYYNQSSLGYSVLDHNNLYSSRYTGTYNKGGGVISASGYGVTRNTFLDCGYGVNFENYFFFRNNSYIYNTDFTTDAAGMGDICYYTNSNGDKMPSNTHIGAWQWYGLHLSDNTFNCDVSFPMQQRPIGVSSVASGITIDDAIGSGNSFSNLSSGVYAAANGCGSFHVAINNNTFDNNTYGVSGASMPFGSLVVDNNNFNVAQASTSTFAAGVFLTSCDGYSISNNTFDRCSSCGVYPGVRGVVINNNHINNTTVHNNTFNNVYTAALAEQNNGDPHSPAYSGSYSGLQFRCNDFVNSLIDVSRTSFIYPTPGLPHEGTIRFKQGTCGAVANSAGNRFFVDCSVYTGGRLIDLDGSIIHSIWYNNAQGGTNYDPQYTLGTSSFCIGTLYNNNDCANGAFSYETACPPGYIYTMPAHITALTDLKSLDAVMSVSFDPSTLAQLQGQHDEIVGYLVRYFSMNGLYDSAAILLMGYNMYPQAMGYFLTAGDYINAQNMHDNLPLSSDDDKLFAWETQLAINLFSAGHTWFDLDSTSRDSLAGIVQYSRLPGYMAGGISSLIGTTPITWPLPVLDSAGYVSSLSYYGSQGLGSKSNSNLTSNSIASNTNCQFSVNPNPTNGNLTIQAPSSGTFIICTLFGQQIQKNYVNSGQTFLQLPPSISPGMYICKFISINGESVKEMKLLYQQP